MRLSSSNTRLIGASLLTVIITAGMLYFAFQNNASIAPPPPVKKKNSKDDDEIEQPTDGSKTVESLIKTVGSSTNTTGTTPPSISRTEKAPNSVDSSQNLSAEEMYKLIEDADARGRTFFKQKSFLEAAACFTEALDILSKNKWNESYSRKNKKQLITITNNRSAMYEKAGVPELVLDDCNRILELDVKHEKARMRKLRVLESEKRHIEALVEVCALLLKFNSEHREQLRLGVALTPPVPQSKIEDLMEKILEVEVTKYFDEITAKRNENADAAPLPGDYAILQLLKSFTGYNAWMASAARDGNVVTLTENIEESGDNNIEKAKWILKRGRRYAYECNFDLACKDFENAFAIVESEENGEGAFGMEELPRLLEWVGMCRHLKYNLDSASEIYERCSELEPENVETLVKRAGVKMDGSDHEAAMTLFEKALAINPSSTDALLHRANLFMLQNNSDRAKADLKQAIRIQPNHLVAHLRLATVFMALQELDDANSYIDKAERIDNNSSELHSYKGEMHFGKGELAEAQAEFEKAMECDPRNATPYINKAMVVMNVPGPKGVPDIKTSIELMEKALEVDPHYHTAYLQLGQLKLSMATNLSAARKVVELYDKGLEMCSRTKEELRQIVSMRILTIAQIDAAEQLKMDNFNWQ